MKIRIPRILPKGVSTCAAILAVYGMLWTAIPAWALGELDYVLHQHEDSALPVVGVEAQATLYVDTADQVGVLRAVAVLQSDLERVTGKAPVIVHESDALGEFAVIIGTLGHSVLVDRLVRDRVIDPSNIVGKWDAYHLQVVEQPIPGVSRALIIAGADRRGTMYGIFDLVEKMGVSPWHFFGDVPVAKQEHVYVKGALRVQDAPVVKYRGIFLNNEAPALTNWAHLKFEGVNSKFYVHIFDLLQRLKANYLWPVMWNNSFNHDDPQSMVLAHEYGIVMGTSHHEPMMRSDKEWDIYGEGKWQFSTNSENLSKFWKGGVERNKPYDSLITLGMRGREDTAMSEGENIQLLEQIIAAQRSIISDVFDEPVEEVPQVWCLYKEVQGFYERGMRVPDDVILLWTNDNWGNIRRLPTPEERKRPGGAGMYYHFDYVGGPRCYRGVNAMPIAKMWEQMHMAYTYEATKVWIVNVGALKFHEFPAEFFLRMAWNPERWSKENLNEFGMLWAAREFGAEFAEEIEALITDYSRHNGRRKVELQAPDTFSLLNYGEADRVLAELASMVERVDALRNRIPEHLQIAFHQLVWHPVHFAANITRLNVAIGRNRMYAEQGRATTNHYGALAKQYFDYDRELRQEFDRFNGGKWQHFKDQPHIGYLFWQSPQGNQLPALSEYHPGDYAEMGIAVEGYASAWPLAARGSVSSQGSYELRFDSVGKESRHMTMFNRGTQPYQYAAAVSHPWILLSEDEGEVVVEQPISVSIDWNALPEGASRGYIEIRGTGYARARIAIQASKQPEDLLSTAQGYLDADGYIAIEAAGFHKNVSKNGYAWEEIPAHGRTRSSMAPYPVSDHRFDQPSEAPYLEYQVTFFKPGKVEVQTLVAPTWSFFPGHGLRYAIAIGDEVPQVVDVNAEFSHEDWRWEQRVRDGVAVARSSHEVTASGPTTIRIYMMDPAVVVQKILVDTGHLLPSYLGPEQSRQIPPVGK
jgi:hypothetical protein